MIKAERKKRESSTRREIILAEAEKVFAAKGYHCSSVAEIARNSGFAVGTLYQLFSGKEHLYTTMIKRKLAGMYADIEQAVYRKKNLIGKVEALIRAHFNFVDSNLEFCRLFYRGDSMSFSDGERTLSEWILDNYIAHVNFIEGIIREGISQNRFRQIEPKVMAAALIGMMNSFKFNQVMNPGKKSLQRNIPVLMSIFLEGVRRNES